MMYAITRFYDDGTAKAKLTNSDEYDECFRDGYDQYVDEIGYGENYGTLDAWLDDNEIDDVDARTEIALTADSGLWCDISRFC
ncbi:MAG: hypothetical protein LBN02_01760 [Oscillospiraceae bacterium]|jgi:hypothetical protein|nr:hypothetical protein [Oscillospiraceae bacterium]